jgi:hypothetical protein
MRAFPRPLCRREFIPSNCQHQTTYPVEAPVGATRLLTPHLLSTRGISPVFVIAAAGATVGLLAVATTFSALTQATHSEFVTHYRDENNSAEVVALRNRGETQRLVANLSFGAAAVTGILSVVFFTQMRARGSSTVDVVLSPDGGMARYQVRF